jgi:hypothetical protein
VSRGNELPFVTDTRLKWCRNRLVAFIVSQVQGDASEFTVQLEERLQQYVSREEESMKERIRLVRQLSVAVCGCIV